MLSLLNYLKPVFVTKTHIILLILFSLITINSNAQEEDAIVKSFKTYTKLPRESVFVHLNKSTFIVGESLGFKAYVFDRAIDKLSQSSSNLYCLITDKEDNVIKKGLFLVKEGTVSNLFEIDSTLKTGSYKFKAYSNWMRNFDEKLSFSQEFSVIDPLSNTNITSKSEVLDLDIQILPESGHSIVDVKNTYGVIVKDQYGKGVSVKNVAIVNKSNDTLTKFNLNRFGIAKTTFIPKIDDNYNLVFTHGYKNYTQAIDFIKDQGIILNIQTVNDKLFVNLNTNQNTLPSIANKIYKLTVHNAHNIISVDFSFKTKTNIIKLFKKANLFTGINIITVFDENNTPLLERLYFNHKKINTTEPTVRVYNTKKDSLNLALRLDINDNNSASISISVLPNGTQSYNHNHNIISYTKLRPYLKGYVEDAAYYFKTIDNKRKQELDNLLITQGWSSYEWHSIFNKKPDQLFAFEKGINAIVHFNKKKSDEFMIHPMKHSKSIFFSAKNDEKTAKISFLFPINDEEINISELDSKGKTDKPFIYLTFEPNSILNINLYGSEEKNHKNKITLFDVSNQNVFIKDQQNLDEVIIKTNIKRTKYDQLKKKSSGNIDIFDDNKREAYTDFATYISSKGFFVNQNINRQAGAPLLDIRNTRRTTIGALQRPLIFLDDVILSNFSILANFRMDTVDYIEIDKSGAGLGIRGTNGVIRIYTDPSVKLNDSSPDGLEMKNSKFPISFKEEKKYYTPKYSSYHSSFYENYGVIDWFPNLKPDNNGEFQFKLINTNSENINLYIEGMTTNGVYISKFKNVKI